MTAVAAPIENTTRQRIIDAALRLIADRGYRGTTVGQIEEAAGLTPRAGGLYKHFASKREVLAAAMQQRSEAIDRVVTTLRQAVRDTPVEDLRSGSCESDVEEDPYEEERVEPDRDERDIQEPGPVHGVQPGALEDPETGADDEAAGRDDGEPEESRLSPDELEARPHQPCAIG